jgi:hypothetical protein
MPALKPLDKTESVRSGLADLIQLNEDLLRVALRN